MDPRMAKAVAKEIICTYLSRWATNDGLRDICDIRSDNEKIFLGHLKAIRNIFDVAIQDMEGDKDGCNEEA